MKYCFSQWSDIVLDPEDIVTPNPVFLGDEQKSLECAMRMCNKTKQFKPDCGKQLAMLRELTLILNNRVDSTKFLLLLVERFPQTQRPICLMQQSWAQPSRQPLYLVGTSPSLPVTVTLWWMPRDLSCIAILCTFLLVSLVSGVCLNSLKEGVNT